MEQDKSNPNDQLPADNKAANDQVFGSSSEFFSELEQDVNGAIDDSLVDSLGQEPLETRNESPIQEQRVPQQATPNVPQGNNNSNIDWEKRYKDSSREAQRLSAEMTKLKPFEPLMDVMRKDSGLITHIKDYLKDGGKPSKSVKEELGLDEDFHYDPNEALDNPESDSAKVFEAHVDKAVKGKVDGALKIERTKVAQANAKNVLVKEANAFRTKHNIDNDTMKAVLQRAATSKLNFEDAYLLVNKSGVQKNMANSVRNDVAQQMQNVRNIPQSASQTNSAQADKSPADSVFDSLLGSDDNVDNLFG
jgi:FtsZ-binding cell division protein ZapB